jgi:hypothetical protein
MFEDMMRAGNSLKHPAFLLEAAFDVAAVRKHLHSRLEKRMPSCTALFFGWHNGVTVSNSLPKSQIRYVLAAT